MSFSVTCFVIRILRKTIAAWALISFCFLPLSFAQIFCVDSQEELVSALQISSRNGENDVINIQEGTELIKEFKILQEHGHTLRVRSGYSEGCVERIIGPAPGLEPVPENGRRSSTSTDDNRQQSTTGPKPPPVVEPKADYMSAEILTGGADIVIIGVPGYLWRHGCGPTAVGMICGLL